MLNKSFWIGFVAVYVVAQVLGFLVHAVLLDAQYMALADVFRPVAEMESLSWVMFVTALVYLFAFCLLYARSAFGGGAMAGAHFGFWVGLLFSVPQAFDAFVVYPITLQLALWWFVTGVLYFVVIGAVFGALYKRATPAL